MTLNTLGSTNHSSILDGGVSTDSNSVQITADNRTVPNRGAASDSNTTDNIGIRSNKNIIGDNGKPTKRENSTISRASPYYYANFEVKAKSNAAWDQII